MGPESVWRAVGVAGVGVRGAAEGVGQGGGLLLQGRDPGGHRLAVEPGGGSTEGTHMQTL